MTNFEYPSHPETLEARGNGQGGPRISPRPGHHKGDERSGGGGANGGGGKRGIHDIEKGDIARDTGEGRSANEIQPKPRRWDRERS